MKIETNTDSGQCDWCKKLSFMLILHKDADEGFFGPEYYVCSQCRIDESNRAQKELEAMGIFDED